MVDLFEINDIYRSFLSYLISSLNILNSPLVNFLHQESFNDERNNYRAYLSTILKSIFIFPILINL